MHLKQLKLAGFKSFVDPTIVSFTNQLVAIVGPNGCGKSNVIDAVRWVMGERYAKNLRGESITDVVFKGSGTRKPVGQAVVELIFDNRLGRLGGEYASYQEIALKRVVTLEGDSQYYLNGSRCRRRDITDLFLGTGANARGYAIIGQDTISRLIEAHPEDLRVYLEEAAGVSKYKERRREALQRIQNTQENLARIADIRAELTKQLARLQCQAEAAESYVSLREQERECRAQILAVKWQAIDAELNQVRNVHDDLAKQSAAHQAACNDAWQMSEDLRREVQIRNTSYQQCQKEVYQLATDIARLEETIQQQARDKVRLAEEAKELTAELALVGSQLSTDQQVLGLTEANQAGLQAKLQQLHHQLSAQQTLYAELKLQADVWQGSWQESSLDLQRTEQAIQLEVTRRHYLFERQQQLQCQAEKNQVEQEAFDLDAAHRLKAQGHNQYLALLQQKDLAQKAHQEAVEHGLSFQAQLALCEQELHQAQALQQQLAVEQGRLDAAQQNIYPSFPTATSEMLSWSNQPRLAEVLEVAKPWVAVCEVLLRDCLAGVVVEQLETIWPDLPSLQGCSLSVMQPIDQPAQRGRYPLLIDKITGMLPQWSISLEHIFAAEDLMQAMSWLSELESYQSILTPQGFWLGSGWVRILPTQGEDEGGVLARKQRLAELTQTLDATHETCMHLFAQRSSLHERYASNQQIQSKLYQELLSSNESCRESDARRQQHEQHLSQLLLRQTFLQKEEADLQKELEQSATEQMRIDERVQVLLQTKMQQEHQQQQLIVNKTEWETAFSQAQSLKEASQAAIHQLQLEEQRLITELRHLNTQIKRQQDHRGQLQVRLDRVMQQSQGHAAPCAKQHNLLTAKTAEYAQLDLELSHQQQILESLVQQLAHAEWSCKEAEQQVKLLGEELQQINLAEQALVLRAKSLRDALTEFVSDAEGFKLKLPAQINLATCEQNLTILCDRINRLGAINLLAIEEYHADSQRKQNLDIQYQDLSDALATLEMAIAKMDKDTEQRLRDTFNQVNAAFHTLFPRLFGGGHATLTLTCDNLLDAGIVVMAQPPGKRNSTIHMLSGGEKALTAVALVFAIFQLNPSPFCMLDEVDAPLDDANVGRFCELVREMSTVVQFLFITHNKITMELAEQFIGVTMREPGVSRVVAVDVKTFF